MVVDVVVDGGISRVMGHETCIVYKLKRLGGGKEREREREIKTETETGKQFNTCRKGERQSEKGVGETKREIYWSMKGWTAVAPVTLFGIGDWGSGVDRQGTVDWTELICDA